MLHIPNQVDRSYLPFQSARNYQDRKMAKWMGFFISEHTSALNEFDTETIVFEDMDFDEKLLYVSQAYLGQYLVTVRIKHEFISGIISELQNPYIGLQTTDKYHQIKIQDIGSIQLTEAEEIE
ncbi:TPA: hypothetical protein ACGO1T_001006 [Streptococcus suis]